eukprot:scaffold18619_cov88-Skeletonema_marinoi.AAC.1
MANYHWSLEAGDCDMNTFDTILCVIEVLMAFTKWASSGHLRRCGDAVASNKYLSREKDASILSWPTIMGH